MGWNFRKSVNLGGGMRLNFSKSGVGISGGVKGFRVSHGPRGNRVTASIPGTGIYYTKNFSSGNGRGRGRSSSNNTSHLDNSSGTYQYTQTVTNSYTGETREQLVAFGNVLRSKQEHHLRILIQDVPD